MGLFERLLGLDLPPGAHLHSARVALRGGLPAWLLVLLGIACIGAAFLVYQRERADIPRRRRIILALLRGAALALLVGLIARPALLTESHGERPRSIALLLDNSASMKQQDRRSAPVDLWRSAIARGATSPYSSPDAPEWQTREHENLVPPSRAELVKAALDNSQLNLIERLQKAGPIKSYVFGAKPKRIEISAVADAMTNDEDRTAIADSLMELINGKDGDPPAAVVLVTDGLENGSKALLDEAAAECAKLGVAVHVYGVGSTESGVVRLTDAAIPDTVFYDDAATVPFRWRARGVRRGVGVVTLTLNGKEVAQKEIPLSAAEGRDTISFSPKKGERPAANGELAISIKLKFDAGPADEIRKPITLSEQKVRVLVIDDTPRWEFKFLQPALSRDRRVEAQYVLAQGDPRAMAGSPFVPAFPSRDKLFGYDLIIVGDVAPGFFGADGLQSLQDFVREGGGLAVIAGRRNMPSGYLDTPLAEVLPVEFVPIKFPPLDDARPTPYQAELTGAGRRSEMLNLADTPQENEQLWRELPSFYWYYPSTKLRPGATTLIGHPRKLADETPMPLLATQYYGKGQVAFLAVDETWRWRYNAGDRLYSRLWGQIVYQLGLPHLLGNGQRVMLALDRSDAVVGRPGFVYARLFDADFKPYITDRVPAVLEALDAANGDARTKAIQLDPVSGRPGEYRALLPHDAPGRFELRISQPQSGSLSYRVQLPPGHELESNSLAEGPMKELARLTAGGYYREEGLRELPNAIEPKNTPFSVRHEVLMWNPLALLVFVGLVTGEWIMRKMANLS